MPHNRVKKAFACLLGLLGIAILFFYPRLLLGVEIAPASAHDILTALGPDSKGLHIAQENLPDLFALTASRIEENAKQFIIEEPYLEGRWQGGKAVIEYARDLSYTLVSIYDKTGHRQRIYSVRTNFTEHVARQQVERPPEAEPSSEAEPGSKSQSLPVSEVKAVSTPSVA